ncbi:3-keto-L-gulonate-6-phosphate decarboxylase UlaD 3-dehydro-L-gulonate-6-phosphate decarboxylase, partial [human gut metagenome]
NADWVTVICCADINTAKGALDVAKEFNGDVQIELTGYWTWEQAQQWRDPGMGQVVYPRSLYSIAPTFVPARSFCESYQSQKYCVSGGAISAIHH